MKNAVTFFVVMVVMQTMVSSSCSKGQPDSACQTQRDCDPGYVCLDHRCQEANDEPLRIEPGNGNFEENGPEDGGPDHGQTVDESAMEFSVDEGSFGDLLAESDAQDVPAEQEELCGIDAGDDTLNVCDLSGDQAKPGAPGAPCGSDENCNNVGSGDAGQDAVCLTEEEGFPGGYCSFLCSLPESENFGCNESGGIYIPYTGGWGDGYCYHPCDAPNDCRIDYRCVDGACRPNCADSRYPCSVGVCDPVTKVCVAE